MRKNYFLKIMPFVRYCEKMWYNLKDHAWQYDAAQKTSALHRGHL
jgi:hypothetical protein